MIENPPRSFTLAERLEFYSIPEPNSGCLLWTGPLHYSGYGEVRWHGKRWRAHRLSWTVHRGEIPAGLFLCHRCDVRACINPDHLFPGTPGDNNRDMWLKGRYVHHSGEGMYNARLTAETVRFIRASAESDAALAKSLGVAKATVNHARVGRTWAHVEMVPE